MPCNKDNLPGIGQCCCNCLYHIPDMGHPGTDGKSISTQRGWTCTVGLFTELSQNPYIHSGWSEHGGCEMWTEDPDITPDEDEEDEDKE